jgi:hypothetical protein
VINNNSFPAARKVELPRGVSALGSHRGAIKCLAFITSLVVLVGVSGCQASSTFDRPVSDHFEEEYNEAINSSPSTVRTLSELEDLGQRYVFDCSFAVAFTLMCAKTINDDIQIYTIVMSQGFLSVYFVLADEEDKNKYPMVVYSVDGTDMGYDVNDLLDYNTNDVLGYAVGESERDYFSEAVNFEATPEIIRKILTKAIKAYGVAITNDEILAVIDLINLEFKDYVFEL